MTSIASLTIVEPPDLADGDDHVANTLADLAAGRPVILTGSAGRHGDLVVAAEHMTPELMAFVVRHSSGFVCVALDESRADELTLPAQRSQSQNSRRTAFGVSVDAKDGIGTGISAADRSHTVRVLADTDTIADDLIRPGHIVTLRAVDGGVFGRQGHTEAGVDLMRLAGVSPVAVLADLVIEDAALGAGRSRAGGRVSDLRRRNPSSTGARRDRSGPSGPSGPSPVGGFGQAHGIRCVSVNDIVDYRRQVEPLVTRAASASVTTPAGEFTAVGYRSTHDGLEHVAFVYGEVSGRRSSVVAYVHVESLIADVSNRSGPGTSLESTMSRVARDGGGVIIYLRATNRTATGLITTLQRMSAVANGARPLPPEVDSSETVRLSRQILDDLGVHEANLLWADQILTPGRILKGCE